MLDQEKRNIALARTLLFNYGQGINTPHSNYLSLCKLLSVPTGLQSLPSFKEIPIPWSFFSKYIIIPLPHHLKFLTKEPLCNHMMLFHHTEKQQFISLPSAVKLNWMRNFYWMQELLFNFSEDNITQIFTIIRDYKKPICNLEKLPFQIASTSHESI